MAVLFVLGVIGFADSEAELIGAGSRLSAAGIAFELSLDLFNSPAVDELGDSLEVSVAAAYESDIGYDIALDVEMYLLSTDDLGFIGVIHGNDLRLKDSGGDSITVQKLSAAWIVINKK